MFLRDNWYVAAMAREIENQPFARTLLGEPVVLYRQADGAPVALQDRCVHRQAPLSLGEVDGDRLRCLYHGLSYEPDGTCVHVPGQSNVPPGSAVQSYLVVERYKWIWIWMGAPERANPDDIPDFHRNEDAAWMPVMDYMHMSGNYQLLIDNLLELSHLGYLHTKTIGNRPIADDAETSVTKGDDSVRITRWVPDKTPPPLWSIHRRIGPEEIVDRWQVIDFAPPSNVSIETGGALAGKYTLDGDRSTAQLAYILNAITPETDTCLHYFWSNSRNYRLDDPDLDREIHKATHATFLEDRMMIEGQQRNYDIDAETAAIDINADAGALHARAILTRCLDKQRQAASRHAAE